MGASPFRQNRLRKKLAKSGEIGTAQPVSVLRILSDLSAGGIPMGDALRSSWILHIEVSSMILEPLRPLRNLLQFSCERGPNQRAARRQRRQRPWLEALEERTAPAVLTVTSLADNLTAGDGLITLREAFNAANTASTVD